MRDKLLIVGAGGHGKVVADIALKMRKWKNIAFLDDNQTLKEVMDLPVIGNTKDFYKYTDDSDFFIAIGNNYVRETYYNKLIAKEANFATLIHPNAIMGDRVEIGDATVIMAGTVINTHAKIGKGCIINTGAIIDHDSEIEKFVHISSGANIAGNVRIGKNTWIGIGSTISNNLSIAGGCKIGAGAVVIRDIFEPGTYVGVPVRKID
jgi:sugar O-acyltransferase (sialic acid O-acetyltransferase NeuD family)